MQQLPPKGRQRLKHLGYPDAQGPAVKASRLQLISWRRPHPTLRGAAAKQTAAALLQEGQSCLDVASALKAKLRRRVARQASEEEGTRDLLLQAQDANLWFTALGAQSARS